MASLDVEFEAVSDVEGKFARLAQLLGLADADHARGKVEHLWMACTTRGESDLPQWLVERHLGAGGAGALVDAELGSWGSGRGDSNTRRVRIAGAEKRCLWMQTNHERASKGGKSRAATASRSGGRFTSQRLVGPHQPKPALSPSPSPSPEEDLSPPARDPAVPQPEPTHVPAVSPPSPAREDIAGTQATPKYAREPSPESPTSAEIYDRSVGHTTRNTPENIRATGEPTLDQLWSELELARQRAAEHHRVTLGPLLAHDARRHDLSNLLAEAARVGQRPRLVGQIRHAIAVAEAEAIADRDQLQWLSGAVFSERNFGRLVAAPAPKKRSDPRPARPRNHDPPAVPRDQLAGPEQFAEARALLAAATSNDAPPIEKPRPRKAVT